MQHAVQLFYTAVKPEMEGALQAGFETAKADYKRFSKSHQPMSEEDRDRERTKMRRYIG